MSQQHSPNMDEYSEQRPRSRSNTTSSIKEKSRPKSRGSTTSLQSVGVGNAFQPTPPLAPAPIPVNPMYAQQQHGQPQMFGYNQQEMMMAQQSGMQPIQPHPGMGHARGMSQQDIRPSSQHGFQAVQPYPPQYQNHMPTWNMQPPPHMQHMRHASEQYEGSPAPEDSNNEGRRKKSTANTLANDQELRRLLSQYQHKTLNEVSVEVQKNEGSGGKSEKAKQVFAMLWLQESCSRSTQSVRRDRVFARYTERCGDMRVPTLNPASFGKLVRIIFPNVQTRRLGVRGESKYHYVDLSLNDGDDERQYASSFDRPPTASGLPHERRGSMIESSKPVMMPSQIERPPSRMAMETADFPAPRIPTNPTTAEHEEEEEELEPLPEIKHELKLDCKYSNTTTIRMPTRGMTKTLLDALPSARTGMPGTLSTYVAMPNINSLTQPAGSPQDNPFELPDIFDYLVGQSYDPLMAQALLHLYRSYCIDVIDAFRKCKEKPFFNHHSAFNGKMTVPVSKLFNLECLAPWIQECDMRMYKQIVRFLAPLALQNVPDMVWNVFDRISNKLVPHLITTFEEKCPVHVVVAKAVPAARFANLLKKLKDANVATLQLSKMLDDPRQRTQMWLDLMVMVEPDRLLDDSMPPAESYIGIQGILKHDLRTMIEPVEGVLVAAAEDDPVSGYANFLSDVGHDNAPTASGVLDVDSLDAHSGLLEKWIGWLESLPQAFTGHHPQCMMDWHTKFWRSLMMQVGSGGALSYQSWWYVEAFAQQMLAWLCEMQGMLMSEEDQKKEDAKEAEKKAEAALVAPRPRVTAGKKRKRLGEDESAIEEERPAKQPNLQAQSVLRQGSHQEGQTELISEREEPTLPEMPDNTHHADEDTDAEMDEITRGGPLDLPSIHTGLTSPVKLHPTQGNMRMSAAKHIMQHHGGNNSMIDDSGIDLGVDADDHDESLKEARKFNKRDWLLSSDPVDGHGGIGLGVVV